MRSNSFVAKVTVLLLWIRAMGGGRFFKQWKNQIQQ